MTVAGLIDQALRSAGIPIQSVSVGVEGDRATWTVQFDPSVTPAQRVQAASILGSVAVDSTAQVAADATGIDSDKRLKAIVVWCAGHFGISNATAKSELTSIYKALP